MKTPTPLDRHQLYLACFTAARNTLWERGPTDLNPVEDLAKRFFDIAVRHEEFITDQGRDPDLITRAVAYLSQTHAIPPMKDDTRWFADMLEVLIELACPDMMSPSPGEFDTFYCDIEEGIASARADCTVREN